MRYCVKEKGLELYAYCVMTNHVHLIVGTNKNPIEHIVRDMKRYTSKQLYEMIECDTAESRQKWMLWIFKSAGQRKNANNDYQIWQQGYHPVELFTSSVTQQKLDYIHHNPVEAGFVDEPEDYLYSSARNYCGRKGLIDVMLL